MTFVGLGDLVPLDTALPELWGPHLDEPETRRVEDERPGELPVPVPLGEPLGGRGLENLALSGTTFAKDLADGPTGAQDQGIFNHDAQGRKCWE